LFETLSRALREHQVLEIDYFSPARDRLSTRRIEPYLLFRSRDTWYVEAFCLQAQEQRTFRLEYIRRARPTGEAFSPREEVDLSVRQAGIASPAQETLVQSSVQFAPRWQRHLSDKNREFSLPPNGNLLAVIPYSDEGWLAKEVSRYLGEAVVMAPPTARQKVKRLADRLHGFYTGKDGHPSGAAT